MCHNKSGTTWPMIPIVASHHIASEVTVHEQWPWVIENAGGILCTLLTGVGRHARPSKGLHSPESNRKSSLSLGHVFWDTWPPGRLVKWRCCHIQASASEESWVPPFIPLVAHWVALWWKFLIGAQGRGLIVFSGSPVCENFHSLLWRCLSLLGVWERPHEAVPGPVLEDDTSHQRGLPPQVLDSLSRHQGFCRWNSWHQTPLGAVTSCFWLS